MKFGIYGENGSGQKFKSKEEFFEELDLMIEDCIQNGGTQFDIEVYADASCFLISDESEEEE